MLFKTLNGLVILAIIGLTHADSNYCKLCSNHIGCNNSKQLSSSCPSGAAIVPMSDNLINSILSQHNSLRNSVANGSVNSLPTANRMATLGWDKESAQLAQDNVNRCVFGHDQCRKTDAFPWAGQNIASSGTTGSLNIPSAVTGMINSWFNEYKNTNAAQIKSYSSPSDGSVNGHFTAMVNQKQVRLGCGAVTYRDGKFNTIILACNYAFTNVIGYPVYTTGKPCSGCTTGCNSQYPALCSPNENISPNPN